MTDIDLDAIRADPAFVKLLEEEDKPTLPILP